MGASPERDDKRSKRKRKDRRRSRSRSASRSRSRSRERSRRRSRERGRSQSRSPSKEKESKRSATKSESATGANGNDSKGTTTAPPVKKRSRFSEAPANIAPVIAPMSAVPVMDPLALAQAKAAEIARGLGLIATPVAPPPVVPPIGAGGDSDIQAALLQEKIRQQLAQVQGISSLPIAPLACSRPETEKKAKFVAFRVDELGREIDEEGNLVKMDLSNIKTVRANIAGPPPGKKPQEKKAEEEEEEDQGILPVMDPRLKVRDRGRRAKKAFDFVEHGTYIKQAEQMRNREARKVIAGYTSGRNPNAYGGGDGIFKVDEEEGEVISTVKRLEMPAPVDDVPHPVIEWWDEAYLPKDKRTELNQLPTAYDHTSVDNCKTLKYVQHPVPVKAGGAEEEDDVKLATYLTKKERKRLRKQARAEREQEKRDKIALGLMPPPPPKMNLGNFMKILGDEAVADPSKVTAMVMKQVEQRKMNHEMRNQARKLTPEERKAKKRKRLLEDTSKAVHVALFRVRDLSNPQIRFKVDVNAQENMLTGGVLMCKDPSYGELGMNLVVAEGGPKAIRRYIKLMLRRIKWASLGKDGNEDEDDDDDDSDAEDDNEEGAGSDAGSKCELLWQGIVPKRAFTGFKFQECKTVTTARRVMEARGVSHYWDMVMKAPSASTHEPL